jgi:hypothetical protein
MTLPLASDGRHSRRSRKTEEQRSGNGGGIDPIPPRPPSLPSLSSPFSLLDCYCSQRWATPRSRKTGRYSDESLRVPRKREIRGGEGSRSPPSSSSRLGKPCPLHELLKCPCPVPHRGNSSARNTETNTCAVNSGERPRDNRPRSRDRWDDRGTGAFSGARASV